MENNYDLTGFDENEIINWNRLNSKIDDIFDFELSLPDYYEDSIFFLKKWQTKNGKSTKFFGKR